MAKWLSVCCLALWLMGDAQRIGGYRFVVPRTTLPPGVTLTAIDGGNTYYADSGWTYAANSGFTNDGVTYSGWDDEDFFPTCLFLERFESTTHADKWDELNANCAMAIQGTVNYSLMATRGVQLIQQTGEWLVDGGNNLYHATLTNNIVGLYTDDEPFTLAMVYDDMEAFPCSGTPPGNSGQTNRFTMTTFTHNQVSNFDVAGTDVDDLFTTLFTTPCATQRTLTMAGVDQYFFNGAQDRQVDDPASGDACADPDTPWPGNANRIYNRTGDMTSDLQRRGARYTDLAKFLRLGNANHGHAAFRSNTPTYIFVETGASYNENQLEGSAIRSAEINAAVWGSLIGGVRFVVYFTIPDPCGWDNDGLIPNAFWDTPYNGDSISNYDQVGLTNALVRTMAPILNSPTASGYLTMSPSEQVLTSSVAESGYATLVKYYNRGASANNKFYIFAIPRYGDRTHSNAGADTGAESWPKTATFTIPNTGESTVTVINESRTIEITNGGTQFQDSFADKNTVHIYKVGS